jgi:hypothetical protein
MLKASSGSAIQRDAWRFSVLSGHDIDGSKLVDVVLEATGGRLGDPLRNSRHASTFVANVGAGSNTDSQVFIKVFAAPRGLTRLKNFFRGSRASNFAAMTALLIESGFRTPRLLLLGNHRPSGRSVVVTARSSGLPLVDVIAEPSDGAARLRRKRALLDGLGAEVGRLHRSGLIHGDLTPFNIFVERGEPPRFVFIDHDRTRKISIARRRSLLRNLVQLGRFDLPGLNRTDRLRVFRAYARELKIGNRRGVLVQLAAMLAARTSADIQV